jgi:hypothetical protein
MDKSAKITYAMIEVAIEKGMRDIEDNTRRGIRNLVDLGSNLSQGRFYEDLFRMAQQMLSNENSPLYDLTRNMIRYVDHELLKNIVIKLAYTCWTYGAQRIREYEKQHGYTVPWTLVFDFRQESEDMLSAGELRELLNEGESIGIYCGMFFLKDNPQLLADLLTVLSENEEGVFFVFAAPAAITWDNARVIGASKNTVPVLHLQSLAERQSYLEAAKVLTENKCLFATYGEYNDDNLPLLLSSRYLNLVKTVKGVGFITLRSQQLNKAENINLINNFITSAKTATRYPFLIIDFYDEIAHVDRTISVEDCFLAIQGNGQIAVKTMDNRLPQLNIRTHSLQATMEKTMPKISY